MARDRPNILIADDDVGMRAALSSRLSLMGFGIVTASNGLLAIEALEEQVVDAAILDVSMPGADGFAVCQHIRSMPMCRDIPVVFLTGSPDGIVRENLEKLSESVGGNYHLTKPVDGKRLMLLLRRALDEANRRSRAVATRPIPA